MNTKQLLLMATPFMLSACGGGSNNTESMTDRSSLEPVQITSSSWQNTQARLSNDATITVKTYQRRKGGTRTQPNFVSYLRTTINGVSGSSAHKQFLIDIDNNPATGFQFDNELWSAKSGVDYLIEDGELYKSTANDSSWSWKWIKTVSNTQSGNSNRIDIQLGQQHDFEPLCNDFNIGYIELDANWTVQDYYPKANHMSKQSVTFCSIYNAPPKITLLGNGLESLVFELNDPLYADPGATASDPEDGDITSKIKVSSNVDIHTVGNYTINYEVKDSQGLVAKKTRSIRVVQPSQTGITVDGKVDDWVNINPIVEYHHRTQSGHFSSSVGHYLKATNTDKNLYLVADSWQSHSGAPASANGSTIGENWQYFIDSDNNDTTGYYGYNYLIENGEFYQFKGINSQEWAWKYIKTRDLSFARGFRPDRPTKGRVELAVAKSLFANLANTIKISFISRNADWQETASFANTYKLKTHQGINHAPNAVEDAFDANYNTPVIVNVLANDTDPDNDALKVISLIQPPVGTVTDMGNGDIKFDPQNHVGSISFSYTVSDGKGGTDTTVVTVATVNPNDTGHEEWPIIKNETVTTKKGQSVIIDVLANDSDPDGDTLHLDQVDSTAHGETVKVDGKVKYTPDAGFTGTEVFWYGVHDGYGHNGAGKVTITVTP